MPVPFVGGKYLCSNNSSKYQWIANISPQQRYVLQESCLHAAFKSQGTFHKTNTNANYIHKESILFICLFFRQNKPVITHFNNAIGVKT